MAHGKLYILLPFFKKKTRYDLSELIFKERYYAHFYKQRLEIRLSENSNQSKRFWKQICKFGEYVNPNGNGRMILVVEYNTSK